MVWWEWSINENDMTKRNEKRSMQNNCIGDANGLLLFNPLALKHSHMIKTELKTKRTHTRKYIDSLTIESTME